MDYRELYRNEECYDLTEFNPFEPLFLFDDGAYSWYPDSEPMTNYDWQEWLENEC